MTGEADRAGRLWPALAIGWAVAAAALIAAMAPNIARLEFPDADDAMRLLEVRDWLAGQSWWDVAQHRLNGGMFPMHWSRLVDLPLAAVMLLLDPLFGQAASTRAAMTIVPLATLGAIMGLAAAMTRELAGVAVARMAVLVTPLSIPIIFQARPLRIDHHGWQIALAMLTAWMLLKAATWRRGAIAGGALATLLTVSLEGLPISVAIAGVAAVLWAWQPERRGFVLGLVWALFGGAVVLHIATRGAAMLAPACDAIAPMWLALLGVAAIGVTLATMVSRGGLITRLALLGVAGAACAAVVLIGGRACLAGPFATLPPIVYQLWYLNVDEGRPIWEQSAAWAAITVGLPIAGLIGGALAWRDAVGEAKLRWAIMLGLATAAFAIALLVNRAGATANAFAVPGAAALLLALLARARAIPRPVPRTFATAGALLAASPGQAAGIALTFVHTLRPPAEAAAAANGWHRPACDGFSDIRVLDRLPAGTVFAPIDVTPDLIATTRQHAVAGGYHRGAAAIARVLTGFTADPMRARAAITASGATYLAVCPGMNEADLYRAVAPHGLWARLERGERFDWLQPVALGGSPVLAWRIVRPTQPPLSSLPAHP